MKLAYSIWGVFLLGMFYFMVVLTNIQTELAAKTDPPFDYIQFEMPESPAYSQKLVASIHEQGLAEKAQESLDKDFWFIIFYVGSFWCGTMSSSMHAHHFVFVVVLFTRHHYHYCANYVCYFILFLLSH